MVFITSTPPSLCPAAMPSPPFRPLPESIPHPPFQTFCIGFPCSLNTCYNSSTYGKVFFINFPRVFHISEGFFHIRSACGKLINMADTHRKFSTFFALFQAVSCFEPWKTMWKVWKISTCRSWFLSMLHGFPQVVLSPFCGKPYPPGKPFWQRSFQTFHDKSPAVCHVISGTYFNHSDHTLS